MKASQKFKATMLLLVVFCMSLVIVACEVIPQDSEVSQGQTSQSTVPSSSNSTSSSLASQSSTAPSYSQSSIDKESASFTPTSVSSNSSTKPSKSEDKTSSSPAVSFNSSAKPSSNSSSSSSVKPSSNSSSSSSVKPSSNSSSSSSAKPSSSNSQTSSSQSSSSQTSSSSSSSQPSTDEDYNKIDVPSGYVEVKEYLDIAPAVGKTGKTFSSNTKYNDYWTIEKGAVSRPRARSWEKSTYSDFNNLDLRKTLDGSTSLEFTYSIKIMAGGLIANVPGKGYLCVYVNNGSSNATSQSIKVNSETYAIPVQGSPIVQVCVPVEKGEYVIRSGGTKTIDLYGAELHCIKPQEGGTVEPTPEPDPEPTKTYTVTFNSNGGSSVDSVKAEKLTTLPTPTRSGYTFDGWYDDQTLGGNAIEVPYVLTSNITLYAKWIEDEKPTPIEPTGDYIVESKGVSESAYVIWKDSKPDSATVTYKKVGSNTNISVDDELVRANGNGQARVDILGLAKGSYEISVNVGSGGTFKTTVDVTSYDRSGYAHDGFSGVGAYNDDGTLKSGVKIVYITEATKNNLVKSITSNTVIRIIGKITCKAYVSKNTFDNYTDISGISRKTMSDDSYFNMVDVEEEKNITLEGVGDDAECFQFGFTWKKCNSIEVRNLTFTSYPEDACSFEGSKGSESSYGNYWVHNNTFNRGKNGWDLTTEKDKYAGDGATDIKYCHNVTMSYNYYNNCKKTMLVGGSDTNIQYNITLHHNHYYKNESRLPLGRTGNVHIYNCYYDDNSTCMSTRNGCFIFSEKNYYYSCANITDGKTKFKIKSFGDVFDGTSKGSYFTEVSSRDDIVDDSCNYDTTFAYKKAPSYVTDANRAKTDCTSFAGPNKANQF